MGNIVLIDDILSAEEEWRLLYDMLELTDAEVKRRMGKFDGQTFASLRVIQELISTAKGISYGQWKGINILCKFQSAGSIRLQ